MTDLLGDPDPIRVFQMNDCEWWAARGTPADALASYMEYTGCSHEESTGDEEEMPELLSDAAMDSLIFTDMDENERPTVKRTFREQLAVLMKDGEKFPCIFACTEY